MKIYISVDMEGVCGVTHSEQCRPSHADYGRFRRLMTQEVNEVIIGAIDGGASEFVVNDSHFTMTNILIEELHPEASLVSGSNKRDCQMEGLDESFDGVFFVGYHQGDGEGDGVINHTLMSSTIRRVRVNDMVVDEALINARVAGAHGVPVAFLSGDDQVCSSVAAAIDGIEAVPVKYAADRLSARHISVVTARERLRDGASAAVNNLAQANLAIVRPEEPARIELEFRATSSANMCTVFPGVERTGPRTIAFEHPRFLAAYRHLWGLGIFAMAVQGGAFEHV